MVTNITNNKMTMYSSIKEAALELNTTSTKIRRHIEKKDSYVWFISYNCLFKQLI